MDFTTNERLQLVRHNVIFQYLNVSHNLMRSKEILYKVFLHR